MSGKVAKRIRKELRVENPTLGGFIVNKDNIDDLLSRIVKDHSKPDPLYLIVDLFCGAGGTTTGFEMAGGIAMVIACVNHDFKAIESHWRNHPHVLHFEEDIRTLNVFLLKKIVDHYRKLYPDAKIIVWASLECTNFSKAKGGLPRNADSRTLAEALYMRYDLVQGKYIDKDSYVQLLNPDYVMIENVVEFMSWGPLDENGKPISRRNGSDWLRWRNEMCAHGYYDEWKEMNSADYGAYTSRNRLFGCFARPELSITWPHATHAKKAGGTLFANLHKWKPVKDVLDFADEGQSIFGRTKDLSEKTLERIYAGLVKYVAKGDTAFISKYYSGKPADKNISTEGPAGTITTVDNQSLVQADFLLKYNSTNGKTGKYIAPSIDEPCPVVSTQGRLGLVQTEFIAAYYSQGGQLSSIESPSPTLPTKDRLSLVKPEFFIDKHFGTFAQNQSIEAPAGSILPNDKHRLVEVEPFLMPTNYDNLPKSLDEPAPTLTAGRRHHYLVNPAWGGNPGSIEEPCCVVVARQDKAPLYFVQVDAGNVSIAVYEGDSDCTIKIKQFMAAYGLVDIKMRMLRVHELLKIQGFPPDYHLAGNQSDQKKFIGNSVVPHVVKAWIEALALNIIVNRKNAVA